MANGNDFWFKIIQMALIPLIVFASGYAVLQYQVKVNGAEIDKISTISGDVSERVLTLEKEIPLKLQGIENQIDNLQNIQVENQHKQDLFNGKVIDRLDKIISKAQ